MIHILTFGMFEDAHHGKHDTKLNFSSGETYCFELE